MPAGWMCRPADKVAVGRAYSRRSNVDSAWRARWRRTFTAVGVIVRNRANLLRRELLDVPQHENDAVIVRQLLDARANGRPRLFSLEQLIRRCTPFLKLLDVMAILLEGRQQDVNGVFWFPASRPQLHERGVYDNPVQPGRKQAGSLKLVQAPKRAEIRGLHDVSGVLVIPREPARDREQAPPEHADHRLKGPLVPGSKSSEESLLVNDVASHRMSGGARRMVQGTRPVEAVVASLVRIGHLFELFRHKGRAVFTRTRRVDSSRKSETPSPSMNETSARSSTSRCRDGRCCRAPGPRSAQLLNPGPSHLAFEP